MEDSLSSGSSERGQLAYIDDTGRVRDGERPDATSTTLNISTRRSLKDTFIGSRKYPLCNFQSQMNPLSAP